MFFLTVIQYEPLQIGTYKYPAWGTAIGWIITVSSMVPIPGYMIYRFISLKGGFVEVNKCLKISVDHRNSLLLSFWFTSKQKIYICIIHVIMYIIPLYNNNGIHQLLTITLWRHMYIPSWSIWNVTARSWKHFHWSLLQTYE